MSNAEQARAFCSALFAEDTGDDGGLAGQRVTLFTVPGLRSTWLPVTDTDAIADAAVTADATAEAVYVSMSASSVEPRRGESGHPKRQNADEVTVVFGVYADLDTADPGAHKATNLPPDLAAIRKILVEMRLPPTILWSSGHGYQAMWRFDEPWVIDTPAQREEAHQLLIAWQRTLAAHAHRLGRWRIDMVHDLARVLRVAGTTNRKVPDVPVPVEIVEITGTRYTVEQLDGACLDREWLDENDVMMRPSAAGGHEYLDLDPLWKIVTSRAYRESSYSPPWFLDVLAELAAEPESAKLGKRISRIWNQSLREGGYDDHSSADASMARHLANLELDERDAAEVIMCMRLRSKHKIEKVQPTKRGQSYLVELTIGKTFAGARKAAADRVVDTAVQDDALDRQDADAARTARIVADAPVQMADTLSDSAAAKIDQVLERVTFDLPAAPNPDVLPAPPVPELESGAPDEPVVGQPAPVVGVEDSDDPPLPEEPPPLDEPDEPPVDEVTPDDPLPAPPDQHEEAPPRTPRPHPETPTAGPGHVSWSSRTESTASILKALSADLIDPRCGDVQIWELQQRGRGIDAKRRVVSRCGPTMAWPNQAPDGYSPGAPLVTGWWPANTFDKVGGWTAALEKDCLLLTQPISADEFKQRYGRSLVRLWQPDSSGGSLAGLTREALRHYLLDYCPTREWGEAAAVGTAWLNMRSDSWTPDNDFVVAVRWMDFGRYVRTNYAQQVGPAVLAEMAELTGSVIARTPEQDRRWRVVRRDYFDDRIWGQILEVARLSAERRQDRHGMRLVSGGRDEAPDGADADGLRSDGTDHLRRR